MTDTERLLKEAAQLRARAAAKEARAKKNNRGDDTARRILLGSWLLASLGSDLSKWSEPNKAAFASWLTRDRDRALFGLPPLGEAPPEKADLAAPPLAAERPPQGGGAVSPDTPDDTPA